jgi:hypothetical protein
MLAESKPDSALSGALTHHHPAAAEVHLMQAAWQRDFRAWVVGQKEKQGLCVVGNSSALLNRGLGEAIDAHSAVVRFNLLGQVPLTLQADVGQRTDIWVFAPGYKGAIPTNIRWAVMSGPDMRFRLRDWSVTSSLLAMGVPVVCVPLAPWRYLVREFLAPPTAGVLLLAWLAESSDQHDWTGLCSVGIGTEPNGDSRHVSGIYHKRSARHNWPAECALVRTWQNSLNPLRVI